MKTKLTIIILTIIAMILIHYSQKPRLDAYGRWYCVEIYGLDENCK